MFIFDLSLLTFTLAVLVAVSVIRIRGRRPDLGSGNIVQPPSRPNRASTTEANGSSKPEDFKGILAHFDGPVRVLQPKQVTS